MFRGRGLVVMVVLALAGAGLLAMTASGARTTKPPISAPHARTMKADIAAAINAEQKALDNPDSFDASVRSSVTWLQKALNLGRGVRTGGAHFKVYRAMQFDKDALGSSSFARNNRERWVRQALGYKREAVADLAPFLN